MKLPDWVDQTTLALVVVGFPLVFLFAWSRDAQINERSENETTATAVSGKPSRTGVEELFGAGPAQAMSSVYLISFHLRDSSYFVRFDYGDFSVIDRVAETKDMVRVTLSVRDDRRFDVRAYRDRLSWWVPDEINRADALYVDRPTGEKIAGTRPYNESVGFSRVLWVNEKTHTAYYREIEF